MRWKGPFRPAAFLAMVFVVCMMIFPVTADQVDSGGPSQVLGTLVNAGNGLGYGEEKPINHKDPHYGWELGRFVLSGYTRSITEGTDSPVFLKNVGDTVQLQFHLTQQLDQLNGDSHLSVAPDSRGFDTYFQTKKQDFGMGALIIRRTDESGSQEDPVIYCDYLSGAAAPDADTSAQMLEEGDYEVALDYRIKSVPAKVAAVDILPRFNNYRIFFTFSVRNGNCMVFPFELDTGRELTEESYTPTGFYLDLARSRYLTIDVTRSVLTEGANGFVEDERSNAPARDGERYDRDGIYSIRVHNRYTNETTEKILYVGQAPVYQAMAKTNITLQELNIALDQGGTLEPDGTLRMPESVTEPISEPVTEPVTKPVTGPDAQTPTQTRQDSHDVTDPLAQLLDLLRNHLLAAAVGAGAAVVLMILILAKRKKGVHGNEKTGGSDSGPDDAPDRVRRRGRPGSKQR